MRTVRLVASIVGVGKAPHFVALGPKHLQARRQTLAEFFWVMIFLGPVAAVMFPNARGWWLIIPVGIVVVLIALLGNILQKRTLFRYHEAFVKHYSKNADIFDGRLTWPGWWRWQTVRWVLATDWLDPSAVVLLHVTEPPTRWVRRDREQWLGVIEARTNQYWAAEPDKLFWLYTLIMRWLIVIGSWAVPALASFVAVCARYGGQRGGMYATFAFLAVAALCALYLCLKRAANNRRRTLAYNASVANA